jgi:hypothetical protein
MRFERSAGTFTFSFEADASIERPTEVYVPDVHFPRGFVVSGPDLEWDGKITHGCIELKATRSGTHKVVITRVG